jgi:hypothetical protein
LQVDGAAPAPYSRRREDRRGVGVNGYPAGRSVRRRTRSGGRLRRVAVRLLALAAFGAAVTAAVLVVLAALDKGGGSSTSPDIPTTPLRVGQAVVTPRATDVGGVCFTLRRPGAANAAACARRLRPDAISYVVARSSNRGIAVAGVAGTNVERVVLVLGGDATQWAVQSEGVFYGKVPEGKRLVAIRKVLATGPTTTLPVREPPP